MRFLAALLMGFFSAFLIYMAAVMILMATGREPSATFVLVTLLGAWALSTYALRRGARTVSRVFSRGSLLGAAEWLAMIPISVVMGGMAVTETIGEGATAEEMVGATFGASIVSAITGVFAVAMALVCLLGFAVSHFIGREMQPESPARTRTCPECAETIQAAARKCRFCGASLVPEASSSDRQERQAKADDDNERYVID